MTDPTSLPNFPPPANESPLRGRVLDALQDEGFRPDLDEDGDVSFKVQGQQLFVRCMEGEVPMMRVFGQWQISEDLPQDLTKQLLAANDVTLSLNIIKTGIANGTLVATGEHLVDEHANLAMLLQTTVQMVLQSVQMWHTAVTSEGPHAANGGVPQVGPMDGSEQDPGNPGSPDAGPQA